MGVHVLGHLSEVTSVVIVEMRVTDNSLVFADEFEVLANLFENGLIGVVPCLFLKDVVGVFVSCRVSVRVNVDLRSVEARSQFIDSLHNLTTNLSHLVKRWQVRILGVLVEVERIIIAIILRLRAKQQSVRLKLII